MSMKLKPTSTSACSSAVPRPRTKTSAVTALLCYLCEHELFLGTDAVEVLVTKKNHKKTTVVKMKIPADDVDGDVVKTPLYSSAIEQQQEQNAKAGNNYEQELGKTNNALIFDTAGRYNGTAATPGDEDHDSGHQQQEDDLGSSGSFAQQRYFVPLGSERFASL